MRSYVIVKSCQRFKSRQAACAETWVAALRNCGVLVWFVEGGHCFDSIGESRICVSSGDSYQDNTVKLRDALALATALPGEPSERFFVCDDDTFVHPKRWLAHEPQGDLECRVFRKGKDAWVNGGAGFWMSRRLCELYVAECNERTSADDVLIARIASKHGIEMIDRPDLYGDNRYTTEKPGLVSADNTLITCHPVQPDEMRALYEATANL